MSPKVVVRRIRIGGPSWAPQRSTITVSRLEVSFDWSALLRGRLRISRLELVEPVIDLLIDKDGRKSWEFTSSGDPTGLEEDDPWLFVRDSTVVGGQITYLDRRTRERHQLKIGAFSLRHDSLDAPSSWRLTGMLNGKRLKITAKTLQARKFLNGRKGPLALQVQLGNSEARANLSAFALKTPVLLRGRLHISRLDIAALANLGSTGTSTRSSSYGPIFKAFELDLALSIPRLKWSKSLSGRVSAHLRSLKGLLLIRNLRAAAGGNTFNGGLRINTKLAIRGNLSGLFERQRYRVAGDVSNVAGLIAGQSSRAKFSAKYGANDFSGQLSVRLADKGWAASGGP